MNHRLILLAIVRNGYGHVKAAQNLACAIIDEDPSTRVAILDVFKDATSPNNNFAGNLWEVASLTPVLRRVYSVLHRVVIGNCFLSRAVRQVAGAISPLDDSYWAPKGVFQYVALHPGAIEYGSVIKKITGCRLSVVATDFVFHNVHCHECVDRYFVAPLSKYVGNLSQRARDEGRVSSVGIPIAKEYYEIPGNTEGTWKPGQPFNVLMSFGGSGYLGLRYLPLLKELVLKSDDAVKFVLIAGRDQRLSDVAKKILCNGTSAHRVRVLGFLEDLSCLMRNAHLLVGKAGGLTVNEALNVGLPMAIIDTMPGQEEYNAAVIEEYGFGIRTKNVQSILRYVDELREPLRMTSIRNSMRSLCAPEGTRHLAGALLSGR